jgi:hypothetical protein
MKKQEKRVFIQTYQPPQDVTEFAGSRVMPFIKHWVTSDYDIKTLAISLYLQGMEDLINVKKKELLNK